jgi:hypothetical protein
MLGIKVKQYIFKYEGISVVTKNEISISTTALLLPGTINLI